MPEEPQRQIQVILPYLSRWRSLKQFLPTALWFIAGIVLSFISDAVLFPLWWQHGGRLLFVRLLVQADSFPEDPSTKRWLLFFARNIVNWLILILAGALGGVAIKRHVARDLCSLGIGFAIVPLLLYAYNNFKIPGLNYLTERGFLILLTICCGMLTHYMKCRLVRKPPASSN